MSARRRLELNEMRLILEAFSHMARGVGPLAVLQGVEPSPDCKSKLSASIFYSRWAPMIEQYSGVCLAVLEASRQCFSC